MISINKFYFNFILIIIMIFINYFEYSKNDFTLNCFIEIFIIIIYLIKNRLFKDIFLNIMNFIVVFINLFDFFLKIFEINFFFQFKF